MTESKRNFIYKFFAYFWGSTARIPSDRNIKKILTYKQAQNFQLLNFEIHIIMYISKTFLISVLKASITSLDEILSILLIP